MKAVWKNLAPYTGKADELVYYYNRRVGRVLCRKKPDRKPDVTNKTFGGKQRQIYSIELSEAYLKDLRRYAEDYAKLPQQKDKAYPVWTNLYSKMMYAMEKADPEKVDLATITKAQIKAQDLPCRSVKRAVEAGLLPEVKGWEKLKHEM
ncbi:MAG: hypothetical protein FJ042_01945 [Candidatus Cloacimonetes bacterium]|nr:hypothetical protein [Candidatus Cloacimonadota bacterium]